MKGLPKVPAIAAIVLASSVVPAFVHAEIVVSAGRSVPLMTLSSIDQACHPLGPVTINIVEAPRGGFIEVHQTRAYPNFNALNTRSRCNTQKLPATQVTYQSSGNFLGLDFVTVEAIFPEGGARRIRVPISVRPILPGAVPEASLAAPDDRPVAKKPAKAVERHARHVPMRPPCHDNCTKAHAPDGGATPKLSQPAPVLTPI